MKLAFAISLFALLSIGPASAQTVTGSLSNFDVFNDTGEQSHGFEIELDGLTSKDVASFFGGTYIRYGDPTLVDIPGVGVIVRYASQYVGGAFTVGTPVPTAFTTTTGHQCWTGGTPIGGYLGSGCEHFGVGMFSNPTAVQYRWLIEDPNAPGTLIPAGSNVNIAAPVWAVTPPVVAGGAAVVNAAIAPPRSFQPYGNAVWVKVFETESPSQAVLNNLLTDDPSVPQSAAQTEIEWELSQSNQKPGHGVLQHVKPLGKGNQSVTRRFEFYKYTGLYDPQTHEALCGGQAASGKSACIAPQAGELGDYIGAQMAAAQMGPPTKAAIAGVSDSASGRAGIASGSWVSIYGSGLSATTRSWQNSDFQGTNLPLALDGVSVTIDGQAAAVSFISPGQLNVQAPQDNAAGSGFQVQVTNSSGQQATGTTTLQQYAPAFFTFPGKYAAAVHADGAYTAPVAFFGNAVTSRPAQPREVLAIFGSGFGPTAPAIAAGQMVTIAAPLLDPSQLHIFIGGVPVSVQFAGLVAPGEYQFNVVVPALPDGDQPITADIGGVATQSGLSIPIKN